MIVPLLVALVGVLALFLIIYLAKGHHATGCDVDALAAQLRPLDVNAFRNLIDEREEKFLRELLPGKEFRRVHRERTLAAVEYVKCAAQNAAILIRLAEAAKQAPDPAVSAAAEKLLDNALRLRLHAFHVVPRLYLGMLVPRTALAPRFVADGYDTLTRQVVMLGCLQFPTRGMSAAL